MKKINPHPILPTQNAKGVLRFRARAIALKALNNCDSAVSKSPGRRNDSLLLATTSV
jgi:hypothetical protein